MTTAATRAADAKHFGFQISNGHLRIPQCGPPRRVGEDLSSIVCWGLFARRASFRSACPITSTFTSGYRVSRAPLGFKCLFWSLRCPEGPVCRVGLVGSPMTYWTPPVVGSPKTWWAPTSSWLSRKAWAHTLPIFSLSRFRPASLFHSSQRHGHDVLLLVPERGELYRGTEIGLRGALCTCQANIGYCAIWESISSTSSSVLRWLAFVRVTRL